MRKRLTNNHPPRRRQAFALDPYRVDGTWTREEILRARGAADRARAFEPRVRVTGRKAA